MATNQQMKFELGPQDKLTIQRQSDGSTTFTGQFTDREVMLSAMRLGWTATNPVTRTKSPTPEKAAKK